MKNENPVYVMQTAIGTRYKKLYFCDAKLLQKSEMRKDIVIELSYKGFG